MAQIAIFGGTGYAGGHIAREAARRGHTVTSYSRTAPAEEAAGVRYEIGSLHDQDLVRRVAGSADVIAVAVAPGAADEPPFADGVAGLVGPAVEHGVRLALVGGAGSSLVAAGGSRVVDGADFPAQWKPGALEHAAVLDQLRATDPALDWFVVSPPALFGAYAPGEATGAYRTGGDVLVTKADGSSEISGADFALAVVDEIESGDRVRERFTVGH